MEKRNARTEECEVCGESYTGADAICGYLVEVEDTAHDHVYTVCLERCRKKIEKAIEAGAPCARCVDGSYDEIREAVPGETECAYHIAGQPTKAQAVIERLLAEAK